MSSSSKRGGERGGSGSMVGPEGNESLRREFISLVRNCTTDEEIRKAYKEFHRYLERKSRDLGSERCLKFFSDVNYQISAYIKGNTTEKVAALVATRALLKSEVEGYAGNKIIQLGQHVRESSVHPDVRVMKMAVRCLKTLASMEGTLAAEFVEEEIRRAFKMLEDSQSSSTPSARSSSSSVDLVSNRRHSAVLCLEGMAKKAPTLFFVHVSDFFNLIWTGLTDKQVAVRESSAKALRAGLFLIAMRRTHSKDWYRSIYMKVKDGLHSHSLEVLHGSLLAVTELLRKPTDFMRTLQEEISGHIERLTTLKIKDDKTAIIPSAIHKAIPLLCALSPKDFRDSHFHYLLNSIRDENLKGQAFRSLGELSKSLITTDRPPAQFLEPILKSVRSELTRSKLKTNDIDDIMLCVQLVSESARTFLSRMQIINDISPLLFSVGLLESMTKAINALATNVPSMLPDIQERLLNLISMTLAKRSYEDIIMNVGARKMDAGGSKSSKGKARKSGSFTGPLVVATGNKSTPLALKVLGTFDFEAYQLGYFVRDFLLNFLDQEEFEVRREAAITCAKIAIHPGEEVDPQSTGGLVVGDIISKLLIVGISDRNPEIRRTVLSSLEPRYDVFLGSAQNLKCLFMGLNDEGFEIRSLSIGIIGRLAILNPAYVMPSLRKTLVQLLTELEFSGNPRNKEESARLLTCLIQSSGTVIKPYTKTILDALRPKVHDDSPRVASAVLAALGELSKIADVEMKDCVDELFPLILETLKDQGSVFSREIALRALGQLVSSLGYVIAPYERYPNLLPILLHEIKTEQNPVNRMEVLRVFGLLGALDPYRHRLSQLEEAEAKRRLEENKGLDSADFIQNGEVIDADQYYSVAAVSSLTTILGDPSLSKLHLNVINILMCVCRTLQAKCVAFLPEIMPLFFKILRSREMVGIHDMLFQQISVLVELAKDEIRDYLDDIFGIVHAYWDSGMLIQILGLVEKLIKILDVEIKVYLPGLVPLLLQMLHSDHSDRKLKVMSTLDVVGVHLADYLHLVIPAVVKMVETVDCSSVSGGASTQKSLTMLYLQTLGRLCGKLDISDYASRITHPLLRVFDVGDAEIQRAVMEVFCVLVYRLGSDYAVFIPLINLALLKFRFHHPLFENLVSALLKNHSMDDIVAKKGIPHVKLGSQQTFRVESEKSMKQATILTKKLLVNVQNLKKAWECSHVFTKDDWQEWMRRFSVALLKESPSHALRDCLSLAQVYHPLAQRLFNYGFFSCWLEIDQESRVDCCDNIKTALEATEISPEILHSLLNLAEFMEHNMNPLPYPITQKTLGNLAEKNHAYAKALHYKEIQFQENPQKFIEDFISINNQLGLSEAARGILTYAQQQQGMELKESWYEKLHQWEEALGAYEVKQEEDPRNYDIMMGRLRCYNALGEWESVTKLSEQMWAGALNDKKTLIAPVAAAGFMNLRKFNLMAQYVERIDGESVKGCFFRAVVECYRGKFKESRELIGKTREFLDTELTALVSESYSRAYGMLCMVQQLSELEEVIEYKQKPERREMIRQMWKDRIWGCQRNAEVWQEILSLRSLALTRMEDVDVYLKYSSLLRKQGRMKSSHKVLMSMLEGGRGGVAGGQLRMGSHTDSRVVYHYLKHDWASGSRTAALQGARNFVRVYEGSSLQARVFHKIAEWKMALEGGSQYEASLSEVLSACKACTEHGPNWYKAWHSWGITNFEAVSFYEKQKESKKSRKKLVKHLVASLNGFFRSIALSPGKSLQDTLRLLSLMFKYGADKEAEAALIRGFSTVSVDTWLQVIPQIIARIHSPSEPVRNLVKELLRMVGVHHPQALVYPLTVASTSHPESNSTANLVLQLMREHSEKLVDQARLVSTELIRVSINWFESWLEALETASRQFFKDDDAEGMLATLGPMHAQLVGKGKGNPGPETQNEISFANMFGRSLQQAQQRCMCFLRTNDKGYLHQAWEYYLQVFRLIGRQLPFLIKINLAYVSPALLEVDSLDLAVPGTYYQAKGEVVRIKKFDPVLNVIKSKQRPRKMSLMGDNGKEFTFLLKGHEDLRQDERVMQLFGLVNTLLAEGEYTGKLHLRITRYGAIPLSSNSGLIGWVPGCNTLHEIIRQFRKPDEFNVELQRQTDFCNRMYERLTLMQKVEVFEHSIKGTPGNEFARVLWTRSPNSEVWLERRSQFTRSIALMSMVGYVLGLGDRHPSNLMLERGTGKVLHIDFGDCFEVAALRDNFPEKVPFRLTRMLVKAMEVSGIEGNFRTTAEWVMQLLRGNKESLMAVLEAFVYDPLINWRLVAGDNEGGGGEGGGEGGTEEGKGEQVGGDDDDEDAIKIESADGMDGVPQSVGQSVRAKKIIKAKTLESREKEKKMVGEIEEEKAAEEMLNARAVEVISRVNKKLTGQDFSDEVLDVEAQVRRLVEEATSHENLSQMFNGWGPFY